MHTSGRGWESSAFVRGVFLSRGRADILRQIAVSIFSSAVTVPEIKKSFTIEIHLE